MHEVNPKLIMPWSVKTMEELKTRLEYDTSRNNFGKGEYPGVVQYLSDAERDNSKRAIASGFTHYKENDVSYQINSLGFRGDWELEDFVEDDTFKLLVMGCSFTLGEGLAYDDMWSVILAKRLETFLGKKVKLANTALCGASLNNQTRLFSMISDHAKFDMAIMLAPHVGRHEYVVKSRQLDQPFPVALVPNFKHMNAGPAYDHFYKFATEEYLYYDYLRSIEHLKHIADAKRMPLLVGSWDPTATNLMIEGSSFDPLPIFYIWENIKGEHKHRMARDGNHPGPFSNSHYVDQIWNRVISLL
jgi:hypothetical protein